MSIIVGYERKPDMKEVHGNNPNLLYEKKSG